LIRDDSFSACYAAGYAGAQQHYDQGDGFDKLPMHDKDDQIYQTLELCIRWPQTRFQQFRDVRIGRTSNRASNPRGVFYPPTHLMISSKISEIMDF
jgi:hypothetical protein